MWICYGFCHRLAHTNTATNRRWMCISEVPLCTCSALLLFISSWSLVGSCFKPLLCDRSSWTMYPKCCYTMFSFCCGGVCAPRISKISSQCERYYVKGLRHLIMQGFYIKIFTFDDKFKIAVFYFRWQRRMCWCNTMVEREICRYQLRVWRFDRFVYVGQQQWCEW